MIKKENDFIRDNLVDISALVQLGVATASAALAWFSMQWHQETRNGNALNVSESWVSHGVSRKRQGPRWGLLGHKHAWGATLASGWLERLHSFPSSFLFQLYFPLPLHCPRPRRLEQHPLNYVPERSTAQSQKKTFSDVGSRVVFQLLRRVQLFTSPWAAPRQASLSFTISWSLLKLMSTESVMPSDHLIFCHPLLLCPQSVPASGSFPMS